LSVRKKAPLFAIAFRGPESREWIGKRGQSPAMIDSHPNLDQDSWNLPNYHISDTEDASSKMCITKRIYGSCGHYIRTETTRCETTENSTPCLWVEESAENLEFNCWLCIFWYAVGFVVIVGSIIAGVVVVIQVTRKMGNMCDRYQYPHWYSWCAAFNKSSPVGNLTEDQIQSPWRLNTTSS
jgi:hypothetical protein